MEGQASSEIKLSELRKSKPTFSSFMHKYAPWLFNIRSLFYFFLFVLLLGFAWMAYSLFTNSFTQLYGWDYTWQFINFSYYFWDVWHKFFRTGTFELYSYATFFGTDNLGSNSYYGLFDPFVFLIVFFPRAAVPQVYAFAAMLKGAVGAMTMRAYLRYMNVSETSSRIGATAFAFCGYLNFMVGFPVTVSMCCTVPLILLGIEKVIREKKILTLALGLFLLGIISFFFLVVVCIWGVLYAIWRYFWTIKKRNWKDNLIVIGLGVVAFAIGIALSAWTLLPSLRETSLSGRTSSMGKAYLDTIKYAALDQILLNFFKEPFTFFSTSYGEVLNGIKTLALRMFEMVGDNPGRELMALSSFFYPTINYLWLPTHTNGGYDAWTASLFCYTPIIIFFISALIGAIRRKETQSLSAFAVCCYLCFTTFAYFFFYAFSGDGYARWFIVLVPEIIYFACQEMDRIKENPKWQLPVSTMVAAIMTLLTYFIIYWSLNGKSITQINDPSGYWKSSYNVPHSVSMDGESISLVWVAVYQMCLVVVESIVILIFKDKRFFWKILLGFVSVETIVCGNLSFFYGSSWSFERSLNNGAQNSALAVDIFSKLKEYDGDNFYRCYSDSQTGTDNAMAFGYNGSRTFHSLYNYGLSTLGHLSHFINSDYYSSHYSYGQRIQQHVWSGFYGNKRFDFDVSAGFKYYIVKNEGYGNWDDDDFAYNVPFNSALVAKNEKYKVYESPYAINLGHAVDGAVYRLNENPTYSPGRGAFYSNLYGETGFKEILRNENIYLNGIILDDYVDLPDESIEISKSVPSIATIGGFKDISSKITVKYYVTNKGYGFNVSNPASFLNDSSTWAEEPKTINRLTARSYQYQRDEGKMVISPSDGKYFNEDHDGAYFALTYDNSDSTRIYMIGDIVDENDHIVKEDVLLCYESSMLENWCSSSERGSTTYSGLFGFYARGKVKHIVYCAKGNGTLKMPSTMSIYKKEKSQIDEQFNKLTDQEHALNDVKYKTNSFEFSTNYSEDKFVVTSIGYDEGWRAYVTKEDGKVEALPMYRADGGFVSFYAPKGNNTYVLKFETKYLKEGLILAGGAFVALVGFQVGTFIYKKKKKAAN